MKRKLILCLDNYNLYAPCSWNIIEIGNKFFIDQNIIKKQIYSITTAITATAYKTIFNFFIAQIIFF